jgi:hypothetical protein
MIPMPTKPKVVVLINVDGVLVDNRNNLGNDLEIVQTFDRVGFENESRGVPYTGTQRMDGDE